jgi:integrase
MPKLIHRVPKYALHKATGQAVVKHKRKLTYLGRFGSPESKQAYTRFIANLTSEDKQLPPDRSSAREASTLVVGELVMAFYTHAQQYYSRDGVPTGEHITIRSCLRPLTNRFAELPAHEFGPMKLKLVREDMIKLDWSRRFINKAVSIAKRCFKWAAEEELIPGRVAQDIWAVKALEKNRSGAREKPEVTSVSDEVIEATLPYLPELDADVIRVMRLTGARPSEVLSMTASAIDRNDPALWIYRPKHHKTQHKAKDRVIYLGVRAQRIIRPRILKAGAGKRLFPTTRSALCHAVHLGCKKAGVPRWSPNMVRHRFATETRDAHGLEAAQVMLGHSRADVTQVYAERNERLASEIARKFG